MELGRSKVARSGIELANRRDDILDRLQLETAFTRYTEKDEPHPQERVELGLMKLNPWRISVSS